MKDFGELVSSQLRQDSGGLENRINDITQRVDRIEETRASELSQFQMSLKEIKNDVVQRPTFETLNKLEGRLNRLTEMQCSETYDKLKEDSLNSQVRLKNMIGDLRRRIDMIMKVSRKDQQISTQNTPVDHQISKSRFPHKPCHNKINDPTELSGFKSLQPPEFSDESVHSNERGFDNHRQSVPTYLQAPIASRENSLSRSVAATILHKKDSVINKLGRSRDQDRVMRTNQDLSHRVDDDIDQNYALSECSRLKQRPNQSVQQRSIMRIGVKSARERSNDTILKSRQSHPALAKSPLFDIQMPD